MRGPLSGLRVIDSSTMVAMPMAAHLMADMGAQVIKVESHTLLRGETGIFPDNELGNQPWNRDGNFNALQRSKLGVTLNFRTPRGIEAFRDLVRISDVLVENNRPGSMDRLGLGYEALREVKPDLVYLSNTGFGHTGPWRSYAGIGRMFELTCGLSQFTGYPDEGPRRVGSAFFDPHVAWTAVFAILAALHYRQQTGKGQWIDLAMYQIGVSTMGDAVLDYVANGRNGHPVGNRHPFLAPHGVYPCKGDDKWIAIATETDRQWDTLCRLMGGPAWAQDEKFGDQLSRWRNQKELDLLIGEWTQEYGHLELMDLLQHAGVPAGAVLNNKELLLNPHLKARNFHEEVSHLPESGLGTRTYTGRPWKMSKTRSFIRGPAPHLGEHNELIVGELLGRSAAEIAEMYELGAMGKEPDSTRNISEPIPLDKQVEDGTVAGYDPDFKEVLGLG